MTHPSVERDERTIAIEYAGTQLAYNVLTFALLIDAMYRSFFRNEAAWDLLALVIAGGAIIVLYQVRHKAVPQVRGLGKVLAAVAFLAAIIGFVVALVWS